MSRVRSLIHRSIVRFPRVSGDEPGDPTGKVAETTFSSRERG